MTIKVSFQPGKKLSRTKKLVRKTKIRGALQDKGTKEKAKRKKFQNIKQEERRRGKKLILYIWKSVLAE